MGLTQENIRDARKFLERFSVRKRLNGIGAFLFRGKPVPLHIGLGGDSYTNGEFIVVGIPEMLILKMFEKFNDSLKDIYKIMFIFAKILYIHEVMHNLCTNFREYSNFIVEESLKLRRLGLSESFATHVVQTIGNIIEDGRIEHIAANMLPGTVDDFQYVNLFFWREQELTQESDRLTVLMTSIWSLAKLGIYPKGYHLHKDTEIGLMIKNEIKPLILKSTKARICKDGLDIGREVIDIIKDILLEEFKEHKEREEEMKEFLSEMLQQLMDSPNIKNSDEKQKNDGQGKGIHIEMPMPKSDGDVDSEEGDGEGVFLKKSPDDSEEEESKGAGGGDESDEEEGEESKSESGEGKPGDETTKEDEKEDGNPQEKSSKDEKQDEKEDSPNTDKDDSGESSGEAPDKNEAKTDDTKDNEMTELQLSEGADPNASNEQDYEGYSPDDIEKMFDKIATSVEANAEEEIVKLNKVDSQNMVEPDSPALTTQEMMDMGLVGFQEIPRTFPLSQTTPDNIKVAGRRFRREIEEIFKNRQALTARGQSRGVLDMTSLYKVGMQDYDVFMVNGHKSISDYAVYILQDGSGSMHGEKEHFSSYALSIMEEGLKGFVPFKITTFSTGRDVIHHVVKNWNDNSKSNYSYSFLQYRRASGCNEDDISIRVATQELLKRPEKDKILIVLSDGAPSSLERTRNAIKDARDKGIFLVGIAFGNESFRANTSESYKYMYEKNIISVEPKSIPSRLTILLKKILIR